MTLATPSVLVVEDGDEYLDNLQAFLPRFHYTQVHAAAPALKILKNEAIDLLFLDMRFDRCSRDELLGNPQELLDGFTLTEQEAWTFIENNQGLYIYRAVRDAGHRNLPVLISYDFALEQARWQTIAKADSNVDWIPDTTTPEAIEHKMIRLIRKSK